MQRRILVATFGSAGDVFPLIPLVRRLRAEGHDVRCAAPRALGLYLRTAGLPMHALGDGSEMRVFDDARIVTTRFGGWASWRHTLVDYVAPTLERDLATLDDLVTAWRPDAIVTSGFAVAARVVAHLRGIARTEASIYPQQLDAALAPSHLAWPLRRALAGMAGRDVEDPVVGEWLWGAGSTDAALLHDPALLHARAPSPVGDPIGFPYWDEAPGRPDDVVRVDEWLAASERPVVLVTLGSFLGARQRQVWDDAVAAVGESGARPLLVGPRDRGGEGLPPVPGLLAVGFVPLSRVVPHVDAVVHHGGIGTMFAALRAGRPAVVLPQAFDQPHNAALVEAAGVGVDGRTSSLAAAVARVLDDPALAARAEAVGRELVPGERAVTALAERVLRVAGGDRRPVPSGAGGGA
jgi:UDP:flavonoid glycosyltransferase YjiC (YdhE family)